MNNISGSHSHHKSVNVHICAQCVESGDTVVLEAGQCRYWVLFPANWKKQQLYHGIFLLLGRIYYSNCQGRQLHPNILWMKCFSPTKNLLVYHLYLTMIRGVATIIQSVQIHSILIKKFTAHQHGLFVYKYDFLSALCSLTLSLYLLLSPTPRYVPNPHPSPIAVHPSNGHIYKWVMYILNNVWRPSRLIITYAPSSALSQFPWLSMTPVECHPQNRHVASVIRLL